MFYFEWVLNAFKFTSWKSDVYAIVKGIFNNRRIKEAAKIPDKNTRFPFLES